MKVSDYRYSPPDARQHSLAGDERWALANRIVGSSGFARAAQLRDLILYISQCAILDPSADVTEQEIGCRVLGRRPDYDTQADNIVRVQIRHLRQKLDEYYATEGASEPMRLTIPKGSRIPHFEVKNAAPSEPPPAPMPQAVEQPPVALPTGGARQLLLRIAGPTLAAVCLAAAAYYLGRISVAPVPAAQVSEGLANHPLWSRMFRKDAATTVVISDSSLVFVQDQLRANLGLQEYGNGALRRLLDSQPDAKFRESMRELSTRQYTSMADATVSSRLAALANSLGAKASVRFSRHIGIRDFDEGNFIIVGSRRGISWVELFEPELKFHFEPDAAGSRYGFRNRNRQKDEADFYANVPNSDGSLETYAAVAFLPNQKRTGNTLLLEGIMMEGTEAAADFVLSPAFTKMLRDRTDALKDLAAFEVLLKIQLVARTPRKVEVVAWRGAGAK